MTAYYNEIDPYAAQWLRNLIEAGHIAPGIVDERSIEDVRPSDLAGYRQCHFFAGVGVWSLALRRAGWPDDRPVWTGSCPCQPFSAAGKGTAFDDERHLWPAFFHLIEQCRPAIVFGEQVASKDANPWIDLVQDDLEGVGYGVGAVPFPSAGIGAPHIRDRLYWVADANPQRRARERLLLRAEAAGRVTRDLLEVARRGKAGRLAHADGGHAGTERQQRGRQQRQQPQDGDARGMANPDHGGREWGRSGEACDGRDSARVESERLCHALGLADAKQRGGECEAAATDHIGPQADGPADRTGGHRGAPAAGPGPVNGFWRAADWLGCTDGKWRPVEPGTFPLAHGAPARVGRLRAYGNAINAVQAQEFIEAVMVAA